MHINFTYKMLYFIIFYIYILTHIQREKEKERNYNINLFSNIFQNLEALYYEILFNKIKLYYTKLNIFRFALVISYVE